MCGKWPICLFLASSQPALSTARSNFFKLIIHHPGPFWMPTTHNCLWHTHTHTRDKQSCETLRMMRSTLQGGRNIKESEKRSLGARGKKKEEGNGKKEKGKKGGPRSSPSGWRNHTLRLRKALKQGSPVPSFHLPPRRGSGAAGTGVAQGQPELCCSLKRGPGS